MGFDEGGVFDPRETPVTREPIQLLSRLAELKVASKVANLGLLTKAEDSGLFSKLEASGAFSQAEKLLPLVDELDLIPTAEKAVNVPWTYFLIGAAGLLTVEAGVIVFVPDDSGLAIGLQAVSGLVVGGCLWHCWELPWCST